VKPHRIQRKRTKGWKMPANTGHEAGIACALDNGENAIATPEMTARYTPKTDDYWVVQSDGYVYLNPKDVFERKYSPLPDQKAA
jgi:hypothetical protein